MKLTINQTQRVIKLKLKVDNVKALASYMGVSHQTVYNWINGKHIPREGRLKKLQQYKEHLAL